MAASTFNSVKFWWLRCVRIYCLISAFIFAILDSRRHRYLRTYRFLERLNLIPLVTGVCDFGYQRTGLKYCSTLCSSIFGIIFTGLFQMVLSGLINSVVW